MKTILSEEDLDKMIVTEDLSPILDEGESNLDKMEITESSTTDPDIWNGDLGEDMVVTKAAKHFFGGQDSYSSSSELMNQSNKENCSKTSDNYTLFDLNQYGFHFNLTPGWANIRY